MRTITRVQHSINHRLTAIETIGKMPPLLAAGSTGRRVVIFPGDRLISKMNGHGDWVPMLVTTKRQKKTGTVWQEIVNIHKVKFSDGSKWEQTESLWVRKSTSRSM